MRIYERFVSGMRIDDQHDIDAARMPASAAKSASVAPQDASNYASAPELAQMVAAAAETDEVRLQLVADVSRRLAAGIYDTHEAVDRTAEAILTSSD